MDFTAGDKPHVILHIRKSLNYTLFDTKWIPVSPRCVLLGNHSRGTRGSGWRTASAISVPVCISTC